MTKMAMRLAAVSKVTLLLLCCSVFSSEGTCDINVATGGNVMVPLTHKLLDNEKLRWMHGSKLILDRKPGSKFGQGGQDDIYQNGSLKLTNVEKKHEGKYRPEVFTEDGKKVKDFEGIQLCVLDPVQKPKVTIKCMATNVKFTCADQPSSVTIEWLQNDKLVEKQNTATLQYVVRQVERDSFVCKVSNLVSSATSDPVTQSCKKPSFTIPEKVLGISIWVFVGSGGGVVLVLIITVILCCVRARRKRTMRMKNEEEFRLHNTEQLPQQQQQQQHQHYHQHQHNHPEHQHQHHHQQQPAGHTGPRQHRPKQHREQHREQQRPRAPEPPNGHPQPSPRRPAQGVRRPPENEDEQPPPLPQPRKKGPKTQRV